METQDKIYELNIEIETLIEESKTIVTGSFDTTRLRKICDLIDEKIDTINLLETNCN